MKKKYLSLLLLGALGSSLSDRTYAQGYEPLLVSGGFTADVIANGTGTAVSKTSAAVDDASAPGAGFAYVSRDYLLDATATPLTYGLPANGIMGSLVTATSGMQFRLHNYDANNSLRIAAQNETGTLTFSNTLAAKRLFIAATTGSGSATVTVRVTFTDATFVDVTGLTIADWYGGSNAIIQGIGRINRVNSALDPNTTNPRIYQIAVDIPAADQSKLVQSITVTKTSSATGIVNVFGATADLSGITCDMPTLASQIISATTANISWAAVSGASSYEYHTSTENIMPAYSATVGTSTNSTSFSLTGNPNTTQYVWVRSVCGPGSKSAWKLITVTLPSTTAAPWYEGFATTTLPNGWSNTGFSLGTPGGGNPGNAIYKNLYGTGTNATGNFNTINVGPLTAGSELTFDHRSANWTGGGAPGVGVGYFLVSVSTDFGTTFTQIDSIAFGANNTWNPLSYPLAAYAGSYLQVKIEANRSSGDYYLSFDNFFIGSCKMPSGLASNTITNNSANVTFSAPVSGTPTGYEFYHSTSNTAPTASTPATGTSASTTAALSSLDSGTTYYVWVRSVCGANDKSPWSVVNTSFTTHLVRPQPWLEQFLTTSTPAGFTTTNWTIGSTRGVTGNPGNNIYRRFNSSTAYNFSTVNVGTVQTGNVFTFDYKHVNYASPYDAPSANVGYFKVSVSTDFGATYTQIDSVPVAANNNWNPKSYPLTAYVGSYVKFRIDAARTSEDWDLAFDNLYVGAPISCSMPLSLVVDATTSQTASVSWTAPATAPANGYEYYYSTTNTAPTAATAPNGTAAAGVTTATISGLTSATTYYIWVRSNCGAADKSMWTQAAVTFATTPSCGDIFYDNGGANNNYTNNANVTTVIYPTDPTDVVTVSFNSFATESGWDGLMIYNGPDATAPLLSSGSTFNRLTCPNGAWTGTAAFSAQGQTFTSTHPTGALTFVFTSDGGTTASGWEAPVSCAPPPSCLVPVDLVVSAITANGSTLNWTAPTTAPANGYEYYYSTTNTAPSAATAASGNTAAGVTTATLNTLTANTTYYVWVRSVCGANDKSDWTSIAQTFTTHLLLPRPWTEGFSNTTAPAGFNISGWEIGSARGVTGNPGNNLYKNLYSSATTGTFTTVNVGAVVAGDVFSFDFKTSLYSSPYDALTAGSGYYKVYVSTDYGTTYTQIDSVATPTVNTWIYRSYPLSAYVGQNVKFKIDATWSAQDFDLAFDNLFIGAPPTCFAPTSLGSNTVTTATANITWGPPAQAVPANGYEYYYSASNTAPTATTVASGATGAGITTAALSTLTANTTYYFWVRSVCGATDKSAWTSVPGSFYTGHCVPVATSSSTYLNGVTSSAGITNLNNPATGFTTGGYADYFNTQTLTAAAGSTVQVSFNIVGGTSGVSMFVDMNNDLIFSAAERVYTSSAYLATGAHTINVTIPAGSAPGTYRARIITDFNSTTPSPCGFGSGRGEAEDYKIIVPNCTLPVVNLGNDTAICAGASLTLNAGNAGATYAWSNGATTQSTNITAAGTYHVTVTNGVCAKSDTIVVTVTPNPVVNLGNDTTICTGSTLTLNAGNAGATYAWSNGATTQTINVTNAGSYHVAVTNGNCTGNDTIVVSVSPNPSVDLGIDTTICEGATLTLNAGNTGATHVWSDASTNATLDVTASGTYHVAVTNAAGCTATDTIEVTVAPLPVVSLGNDTAICEGETLTLDATGTTTDTYLWSDQSTNPTLDVTTAGAYHVTITSAFGCIVSDTIEVDIAPLPSADNITVTGTSPNFSFGVTNGADINNYLWDFGDGQTSTQENPSHVYTASGTAQTIEVSVVIFNDCGSDTLYTQVTIEPVSVKNLILNADALKLYPNPTAHNVTVENVSQFKMKRVIITNILGQQVAAMPIAGNKQTIDVSNLTSGSYHVKIEFEEGAVVRKLEILK